MSFRDVSKVVSTWLVLTLVLAGCSPESPSEAPLREALPEPGNGEVIPLLDFTAPLVEGGTLSGSTLAGSDVAIWFWAPW